MFEENIKIEQSEKDQKNISQLLADFEKSEQPIGEKIEFSGVGEKDVYNITAPFVYKEKEYIIGRVESSNKDTNTQSIFFEGKDGVWQPAQDIPALDLQDSFVTQIDDEFIIGGVKLYENFNGGLDYLTAFFRGDSLNKLREFAQGPKIMKDIRIKKLSNGKIGVFTRPGSIFTRKEDKVGGMVGYTEIDSLDDLTPENLNKAEIIDNLFGEGEWGGANEAHLLENGNIGVLGHIARFNKREDKEYYAMTWEFNPQTKTITNKKIIATRKNFPEGKAKILENEKDKGDEHLANIIFSGGLTIKDGKTTLYVGLSDSEAGKIEIEYPFSAPVEE